MKLEAELNCSKRMKFGVGVDLKWNGGRFGLDSSELICTRTHKHGITGVKEIEAA